MKCVCREEVEREARLSEANNGAVARFVVRRSGESTNTQTGEKRWAWIACDLRGQVRGFYMRNRDKYLTSKARRGEKENMRK